MSQVLMGNSIALGKTPQHNSNGLRDLHTYEEKFQFIQEANGEF